MITLAIIAFSAIFLAGVLFLVQGPQYVPTNDDDAAAMVAMVMERPPARVLDMGSGDGKLVLLLARQGCRVDGVELNPLLVLRSRRTIRKAGLSHLATIYWSSFWKFNVAPYDAVTLFVVKHIMPRLEEKLAAELKPGATVISNYFTFPNLKPQEKRGTLYAYRL